MKFVLFNLLFILFLFIQASKQPEVGSKAPDFSLNTIQGKNIELHDLYQDRPLVLVVLRGWPGYQCPICTRQVGDLVANANKFAEQNAQVLMVYPGPSEQLQEHAREFSADFDFPENFYFTIDPNYLMINKYGLRWEAPKETAYPSTFVIDKNGEIVFAKISTTHGGRAEMEEILTALENL